MYNMIKYHNVMVPMKDGVQLATDVYLPKEDSVLPVLIKRTPYDKDRDMDQAEIEAYVNAEYIVVSQDVRGRYASEGIFEPYVHEAEDGLTLYEWVLQQPWCNGHLGTFGGSYHGGTQWLPAMSTPKGLEAMVPVITFDDMFDGSAYQGGAKVLHDLRWTCASIIPDIMRRAREAGEVVDLEEPEVYNCLNKIPLADEPAVSKYAKYYLDWMNHSVFDDYWKQFSPKLHYPDIVAPALNISGWYDIFVPSTLRNYRGMRDHGGSKDAQKYTRVIMGPWTHMDFSGKLNEFDFGENASDEAIDLIQLKIDWYDHWLKGKPMKFDSEKPVKIFLMGANKWLDESDWPLPDTTYVPYYFHSNGDAKTENGGLSTIKPKEEKSDTYVFDPLDPVPTIGGQVILPGDGAMGPRDQRPAEQREDVLVFETEPLTEDLCVVGWLKANLFVSSDCLDTDFTVKITDVDESGVSRLLSDGILRMRYRDSMEKTELMEPGKIYEITVDVAATANTFLKGHRIRVSISSCNFPRFNRNSNTGGSIFFEKREEYKKAENTLYHDKQHPSHIVLPIVNR